MIGLFKSLSQAVRAKPVRAGRVYLRPPVRRDAKKWLALRGSSRSFLEPWEPTWPKDALTRKAFFRRLRAYAIHTNSDTAYIFLIFRSNDRALLGGISINDVRKRSRTKLQYRLLDWRRILSGRLYGRSIIWAPSIYI